MAKHPLVSVCCITYNQEKFVKYALDGFVMQKTNFPFEVIISDDRSTDDTRTIITEYAQKYPDIIKPIFHNKNLGSLNNYLDNFKRATGKYVAMCEGDDYWTDPEKLQKQVDFLETNPDYSISFHPVEVRHENDASKDHIFPEETSGFDLDTLLDHNFIQTNSVMYRRLKEYKNLSGVDFAPGDWYLHVYHARFGKIGFMSDVMATYRKHDGGMWAGTISDPEGFWRRYGTKQLEFCTQLLLLFPGDKDRQDSINMLAARILYEINNAIDAKSDFFRSICKKYPEFIAEYVGLLKRVISEKDLMLETRNIDSKTLKIAKKTHSIARKIRGMHKAVSNRLSGRQ
ncbi:MAG TPA: glycosyltransferase [Candidatus Saccharimonadales bacterium]